MAGHHIIVVGASAGGVETLPKLVGGLPENFQGSLFVVLHIPATAESFLPRILTRAGPLEAVHPKDGDPIEKGKIYVAPPDYHLWFSNSHLRVTRGPRVNRHRPAIDPLFESAAHNYGSRVVGVVMTGYLDDGADGLYAVKKCGGVAVVQNPKEAMVPDMPRNAMRIADIDHCLTVDKMQSLLVRLSRKRITKRQVKCEEIMRFNMDSPSMTPDAMKAKFGAPSGLICPDCNGPLWELKEGKTVRFRCLVGHSYAPDSLLCEEGVALERALWVAVKTLEERSTLLRNLARRSYELHQSLSQNDFEEKARQTESDAALIRTMVKKLGIK
ncbi:MAG: CheB methylesterase [Verrucomicrobiales bacterium]|nr:CheB methylesterase [Verrucomicrobiales bacterium]